ncbi:sensor histidine kinase [Pararhodobacter marinus]|uniref:sensor histidine kinase n=1 Tax=Pararhodobacter marinus TaxID=2184063 RepID=UPI003515D283
MTASGEHPSKTAAGRSLGLRLAIHLAVVAWVGVLVLVLQVIPYPGISGAERLDAAEFCVYDRDWPSFDCLDAGRTTLPAAIHGDDTTLAVYRVSVQIDDRTPAMALLIPRAIDAVHVRVNGSAMTPTRGPDEILWHDWNRPLYIGLPASVLSEGDNSIEIELRRENRGRLALYPFYIGPADALQTDWQLRFAFTTGASRMNWAISVILTLASLALWRMSPRSLGFGWLALTGAACVVLGSEWAFPNITPHHAVWTVLCYLSMQALAYGIFRFLYVFFGDPSRVYLSLIHAVMAANLGFLLLAWTVLGIHPDPVYTAGLWIMAILTLDWLLSLPARGGRRPAVTLFFLFSLSVALATTQWIDTFGPVGLIRAPLAASGLSVLFIGLSWSLLQRFDELRRQRDRLTASLTEQVARKSAELERSYAALARQDRTRTILQERQRIMLDLHDGIGGHLVNTLAYMENSGQSDPVLQNAIEDALRDMGLMIDSLNVEDDIPVMLGMIRDRLEPLLVRHRARFEWQVDGDTRLDNQTPSDVLALMRIVQEAITNAVKHSGATVITVASEDRAIRVADNGSGFDVSGKTRSATSDGGFGLRGMRQRAADIGIGLEIRSSGTGTVVALHW